MVIKAYAGWDNYETWNVSLWINNDAQIYEWARGFMVDYGGSKPYQDFVDSYGLISTPDGVLYGASELNIKELNDMMKEL
jgi:hypothetical protein